MLLFAAVNHPILDAAAEFAVFCAEICTGKQLNEVNSYNRTRKIRFVLHKAQAEQYL